jgi:hypothetical protein
LLPTDSCMSLEPSDSASVKATYHCRSSFGRWTASVWPADSEVDEDVSH